MLYHKIFVFLLILLPIQVIGQANMSEDSTILDEVNIHRRLYRAVLDSNLQIDGKTATTKYHMPRIIYGLKSGRVYQLRSTDNKSRYPFFPNYKTIATVKITQKNIDTLKFNYYNGNSSSALNINKNNYLRRVHPVGKVNLYYSYKTQSPKAYLLNGYNFGLTYFFGKTKIFSGVEYSEYVDYDLIGNTQIHLEAIIGYRALTFSSSHTLMLMIKPLRINLANKQVLEPPYKMVRKIFWNKYLYPSVAVRFQCPNYWYFEVAKGYSEPMRFGVGLSFRLSKKDVIFSE
jgi:hypothetical protein